jgi:hypothetical protein
MWEIVFVGVSFLGLTGRSDAFLINKERANRLNTEKKEVSEMRGSIRSVRFGQADRSNHSD